MNHNKIIEQLTNNADVFSGQLALKLVDEYTFKPNKDKWCMLEVVCHLVDEEREDFSARIQSVLDNPKNQLPGFNPVEWVISRKYIEQDFETKVGEFLDERRKSIAWLKALNNPTWTNAYYHPKVGPLSAEFFLANWLAHDFIHIRQINRLSFEYLQDHAGVNLDYAGNF